MYLLKVARQTTETEYNSILQIRESHRATYQNELDNHVEREAVFFYNAKKRNMTLG